MFLCFLYLFVPYQYLLFLNSDLAIIVYLMQVIAESLSEEEIAGLKEMFKMMDADNSGHITVEELKNGLEKVGANLKDSEINGLMQAVSANKMSSLITLHISSTK